MSQPSDEDVEETQLHQKWRKIVAYDSYQGIIDDYRVSIRVSNCFAGLKINKIKERVHPNGYKKPKQGYDNLLLSYASITHVAKRCSKTCDERRIAKPAKNNSAT